LHEYTRSRKPELGDVLEVLSRSPEVLVVLNHPLWDIEGIGADQHTCSLREFLARYGCWVHALEVNGYRSWRENRAVIQMAEQLEYPIVSGGDRHGCDPNAMLNLTRAKTFSEFVAEVREDSTSRVLLMPEYRESLFVRTLGTAADVLRYYPENVPGAQRWSDRIFVRRDGDAKPISHYWKRGGPVRVRSALWLICRLGSRRFRPALRLAMLGERVTL
jgi:hypothetical protein